MADQFFIRNKINILIRISGDTHTNAHTHTVKQTIEEAGARDLLSGRAGLLLRSGFQIALSLSVLFLFVSFWVTLTQTSSRLKSVF